ncbi:CBS domain-containing protein [Oceanobacillus sp. Castelsardo]|uniref:CBS domain-containing protein n=1 Tax=Oceanobacillus sp. Castelsardo TaxID=1851204 RepID=UPI000837FDEB|nr:CBS domain-containing protein [Oceanobacillus sp. Castelsardo]
MKNSDVFLASFNRIDKELKSSLTRKEFGFSRAVRILQKSNPLIKRYKDDLLEFAELRNAIVHNRTDVSYVIAEPHDSIVESIIKIEEELTKPKIVYSYFARKVYTLQANEKVLTLLEVIREREFTKFPIYNGKEFLGLITQKGITNWLANEVYDGNDILIEKTLSDVLQYEDNENYKFISGNSSLYEAVDLFKEQIGNGHRLEAILITENGAPTESLVGIVTNWDIMKVNT